MPLTLDPKTSKIIYEGQVVGEHIFKDGISRVHLNITYECAPEEWVVPLSWFSYGLGLLDKHKPREKVVALTLKTAESEIAEEYQVLRFLTEKTVKRDGYVWQFHKSDADNWPSELHAHDYEKNLKLDALTGNIYDAATRQCCKKLRTKELERIQGQLRASEDFAEKLTRLLTPT